LSAAALLLRQELDLVRAASCHQRAAVVLRSKAQEQREKLEMWSDEQKSLKEEVKRKMREEIEKAERAKKEKLKEQMLEEERQKEIVRIREEVR